jgi:hypothetical protein
MNLKTSFDPSKLIAAQQIDLTRVGHVEISTVRLPKFMNEEDWYVTCLFSDTGPTMVVASYASRTEAIFGHGRLVSALGFYEMAEIDASH